MAGLCERRSDSRHSRDRSKLTAVANTAAVRVIARVPLKSAYVHARADGIWRSGVQAIFHIRDNAASPFPDIQHRDDQVGTKLMYEARI